MLEKSAITNKDDDFPTYKTDIMSGKSDMIAAVSGVGGVGPIAAISGSAGSIDGIEIWRHMSEVYKERRLQREKAQNEHNDNQPNTTTTKNFSKEFQKDYEHDSLAITSSGHSKNLMDDIMEKIWLANLDVSGKIVEAKKDHLSIPDDGILRIGNVMSRDVISIIDSTTIEQVASLFNRNKITGVPVVHYLSKHLLGVISMSDIIKHTFEGKAVSTYHTDGTLFQQDSLAVLDRPARDFMETNVITVPAEFPVSEACKLMEQNNVHRVIVTDTSQRVLGVFSSFDVVKLVASNKI